MIPALAVAVLLLVNPSTSVAVDLCEQIAGASVIADDGEYLGKLTNKYSSESILNEYGDYGSKYSSKSIWNEYGNYGGRFATLSPFNPYTSTPPVLVKGGEAIAYLSVSKTLQPAVNPHFVRTCEF